MQLSYEKFRMFGEFVKKKSNTPRFKSPSDIYQMTQIDPWELDYFLCYKLETTEAESKSKFEINYHRRFILEKMIFLLQ